MQVVLLIVQCSDGRTYANQHVCIRPAVRDFNGGLAQLL